MKFSNDPKDLQASIDRMVQAARRSNAAKIALRDYQKVRRMAIQLPASTDQTQDERDDDEQFEDDPEAS